MGKGQQPLFSPDLSDLVGKVWVCTRDTMPHCGAPTVSQLGADPKLRAQTHGNRSQNRGALKRQPGLSSPLPPGCSVGTAGARVEKLLDPSSQNHYFPWLVLPGGGGQRFRPPGAASVPSATPCCRSHPAGRVGMGASWRAEWGCSTPQGTMWTFLVFPGGGPCGSPLSGAWQPSRSRLFSRAEVGVQ